MKTLDSMNRLEFNPGKRWAVCFACLCSFGLFGFATQQLPANELSSNESSAAIIRDYAENLRCVGFEMRDEIKTHFKRSKGYGKMLAIDLQIRTRSAAVSRRVCRNACYRGLERDVQKLKELTCDLTALYDQAVCRAAQCLDRPISGDTIHVADKLLRMNDLVGGMCSLARGTASHIGEPTYGTGIAHPVVSDFNPNVDVAPGIRPEADRALQLAPRPAQTHAGSDVRTLKPDVRLEAPLPNSHSVLEK